MLNKQRQSLKMLEFLYILRKSPRTYIPLQSMMFHIPGVILWSCNYSSCKSMLLLTSVVDFLHFRALFSNSHRRLHDSIQLEQKNFTKPHQGHRDVFQNISDAFLAILFLIVHWGHLELESSLNNLHVKNIFQGFFF